MTTDEFAQLLEMTVRSLENVVEEDWSRRADASDWTCWQTLDHMIDCLFSYALQLAARAESGFLPFKELHAQPNARPEELIAGLRGVGAMFLAVTRDSAADVTASDGVLLLTLRGWCDRAAYEIALHAHDVLSALGGTLDVPVEVCSSIVASPSLWMLDRDRARTATDPWTALLLGSGRPMQTRSARVDQPAGEARRSCPDTGEGGKDDHSRSP